MEAIAAPRTRHLCEEGIVAQMNKVLQKQKLDKATALDACVNYLRLENKSWLRTSLDSKKTSFREARHTWVITQMYETNKAHPHLKSPHSILPELKFNIQIWPSKLNVWEAERNKT